MIDPDLSTAAALLAASIARAERHRLTDLLERNLRAEWEIVNLRSERDLLKARLRTLDALDTPARREERYRLVVRLRDECRLTYRQIGVRIGLSPNGAYDCYRKARAVLAALEEEEPTDVPPLATDTRTLP